MQGDVDKRGDLLRDFHMEIHNIEQDLMEITPEGKPLVFEKDEFLLMLAESKQMADNFHQIQLQIGS